MLSAARRPLMEMRFHTPQVYLGKTMNNRPPDMKKISRRENSSSRVLVRWKICSGVSGIADCLWNCERLIGLRDLS